MKYTYKNLKKHVQLHGIPPGGTKTFDHPIAGGGIELIEEEQTEKKSASPKPKAMAGGSNLEKRYFNKEKQGDE